MQIEVNGVTLNYEVEGSGRPLLLVHGNTQDHTIFRKGVELLKEHYTCYMVDSRGHGKSSKVAEYHYDDMADDYIAFCEKLGLRDIYYYGLSDGGILGVLIAARSDIISKMVISGANSTPDGAKASVFRMIKFMNFFLRDARMAMMFREPNITKEELGKITAKTLVCAGSKDVIREEDTRFLAANIPGAALNILDGEGHASYVVKSDKFAKICLEFFEK